MAALISMRTLSFVTSALHFLRAFVCVELHFFRKLEQEEEHLEAEQEDAITHKMSKQRYKAKTSETKSNKALATTFLPTSALAIRNYLAVKMKC